MSPQKPSRRPFCFECGKQLVYQNGKWVFALVDYHGTKVKMHKDCAKRHLEEKPLTAQLVRNIHKFGNKTDETEAAHPNFTFRVVGMRRSSRCRCWIHSNSGLSVLAVPAWRLDELSTGT